MTCKQKTRCNYEDLSSNILARHLLAFTTNTEWEKFFFAQSRSESDEQSKIISCASIDLPSNEFEIFSNLAGHPSVRNICAVYWSMPNHPVPFYFHDNKKECRYFWHNISAQRSWRSVDILEIFTDEVLDYLKRILIKQHVCCKNNKQAKKLGFASNHTVIQFLSRITALYISRWSVIFSTVSLCTVWYKNITDQRNLDKISRESQDSVDPWYFFITLFYIVNGIMIVIIIRIII
jgi:hypothetical protein